MKTNMILNYSSGAMLQSLCTNIINSINDRSSVSPWLSFVNAKLRELTIRRPIAWERTESDRACFKFLCQIKEKLEGNSANVDDIDKILHEINSVTRDKIHALFLAQETFCWNSLASVFAAAEENESYCANLVYTPFVHQNATDVRDYYEEYVEMGLPVIRYDEYKLEKDSPDVVFMIKPYGNVPEKYLVKSILSVVPKVVYIPYGMEVTVDLIKYAFQYYLHYKAWRHCAYGAIVKEYAEQYGFANGENVVVWGHPKADCFSENCSIPDELKQFINGRKTILWTPHHLVNLDDKDATGTWLIWGKAILEFALKNKDIAFIFRPHPLMIGTLINGGYATQDEIDEMQRLIEESGNIYWDKDGSYVDDFNASDAIITDGTTFSVEYLYTKKPIILTPRNMSGFYMCEDMMQSYYIVNDISDVAKYINMIRIGEDPMKNKRIDLYKRLLFVPEGKTVGNNIIENVKKELLEEARNDSEAYVDLTEKKMISTGNYQCEDTDYPLFSIVILTYKNVKLLYGMLDSILEQDYPRIQLIVSDDGSSDFSVSEIERYINIHSRENIESVLVLKNAQNMGTVKHINRLMNYVDGEYFAFSAADDRFCNIDDISCYVQTFRENRDRGWIVAKCRVTSPDYNSTRYISPTEKDEPYFQQDDPIRLYSRWSRRGMAIPCSMAFKRETFKMVGGIDERYKYIEDWPLVLRLLRNGYMPVYLDKIVALHSAGGVTNTNVYGGTVRRDFFLDKYLLTSDETEANFNLLTKEDQRAYKQYKREIMDRHWFFYIELPSRVGRQRARLLLSSPRKAWWFVEDRFKKHREIFQRKKMFVVSQILFAISLIFELLGVNSVDNEIYTVMRAVDKWLAIALIFICFASFAMEKYCRFKDKQRRELVN